MSEESFVGRSSCGPLLFVCFVCTKCGGEFDRASRVKRSSNHAAHRGCRPVSPSALPFCTGSSPRRASWHKAILVSCATVRCTQASMLTQRTLSSSMHVLAILHGLRVPQRGGGCQPDAPEAWPARAVVLIVGYLRIARRATLAQAPSKARRLLYGSTLIKQLDPASVCKEAKLGETPSVTRSMCQAPVTTRSHGKCCLKSVLR